MNKIMIQRFVILGLTWKMTVGVTVVGAENGINKMSTEFHQGYFASVFALIHLRKT